MVSYLLRGLIWIISYLPLRGYRAAVYCRLSKDDDLQGESASIANQRDMLEKYCEKQGWAVVAVYQDDGFTGLNMERPDLQRMLRAIERRQINLVITKDLSRLGRNYLQTGHLIEDFFPRNGVRYIAMNDGIDTLRDNNDIAPFKNILNEMYSNCLLYTSMKWNQLQNENSPLRAMLNGKLQSVSEDIYDSFILREIAEQPEQFKMAIVIGNVLGKYQLGISDVWISNRIDKMLEDGVLEIIQDAPKLLLGNACGIVHRRTGARHVGLHGRNMLVHQFYIRRAAGCLLYTS